MGKIAIYRYAALMFMVVQIVVTLFTISALFGGTVTPIGNTALAMLVYILPLLIIANLVMAAIWAIRRKWIITCIPLVTILMCLPYIGTMYQISFSNHDDVKNGLKISTYNVAAFGHETSGFMAQDILAEMKRQKVDVCCLQEYSENSNGERSTSASYQSYFPYKAMGRSDMAIFSRYPITASKAISFGQTNNSAMWADISVKGKKVRVFNVHMETTGFNRTLHVVAKQAMKGNHVEDNKIVRAIYDNYTLGMVVRAGQAELVASEMSQCKGIPRVICGDFNDVPYSYTYNTLLGDMVDGFKECGSGWMSTYRGSKSVRIDYIFHDEGLEGVNYYTTPLTYSDHLPVFMQLKL